MVKLIGEINVRYYSDGTYNVRKVKKHDLAKTILEASEKTKQPLLLLLQMEELQRDIEPGQVNYPAVYNEALPIVADNLGIGISTVRDKLERQRGKSAGDIQSLIKDFFENGNPDFENLLLKDLKGTHKANKDELAIREVFKSLKN